MKRPAILIIFALFLSSVCLPVYAASPFPDSVVISQEIQESFLDIINLGLITEESDPQSIACFNVSSDGMIALGFENFDRKTVNIYAQDGSFLYGYRFTYDGSIGISFEGENINIYFAKSGYIATFNPEATCISIAEVPLTKENNERIKDLLYSSQVSVNNNTYRLERDVGFGVRGYSRLVVIDENGLDSVLFDVSTVHNATLGFAFFMLIGFILLVVFRFYKQSITPNK